MNTVTIGVPVFNGEEFLAETLESLSRQTFGDFRVIISDNASTDATPVVAQGFVSQDSRFSYLRQDQNLGAARNYSLLAQAASTPLFKWVAADDPVEPTYLERCIQFLADRPEFIGVYTNVMRIDSSGRRIRGERDRLRTDSESPHLRFRDVILKNHSCWAVFGVYRTDVLRRTHLIREFKGADRALLAELALHGPSYRIPQYLQMRRVHARSFSSGVGDARERAVHFWTTSSDVRELSLKHAYSELIEQSDLCRRERLRCQLYVAIGLGTNRVKYRAMSTVVWPSWRVATRGAHAVAGARKKTSRGN